MRFAAFFARNDPVSRRVCDPRFVTPRRSSDAKPAPMLRARKNLTSLSQSALQDAVAMSVLVVVQEATDIALHIATDEGWELGSTYREAFAVLERHGVITAPLAASLGGAAQLRNRIAHGYASLDAERLLRSFRG
jgi:uncharacterized protein YutE (UPF0331/DUF86 family)